MTVVAKQISPTEYRYAGEVWAEVLPIEELDGRLAFYRRMAKKYPPHYTDHVKALEALKKNLESGE